MKDIRKDESGKIVVVDPVRDLLYKTPADHATSPNRIDWQARAEAAEAKYARLVERLRKSSLYNHTDDLNDLFCVLAAISVMEIEAAIEEREAEG